MDTSTKIELAMVLRLQQLRSEGNTNITYDQLEGTLKGTKWKDGTMKSLHEIVDDILSVSVEDIVRFYSKEAQLEGYYGDMDSFDDILGGKEYEYENE
ncbi:MAG: hypothetical protein HUJ56_00595 [Erysipelotrichaceae bacterium]|nr:hypothetical protein [Erysipelotrichaceae bacterium]